MKRCSRCELVKPNSDFTVKCKKTGRLQSHCRPCKKIYNVEHYSLNRDKRIRQKNAKRDEYKLEYFRYLTTLSCKDCGISDHRIIEFDHLGDKDFNISKKAGEMPLRKLMLEINKCEPVCANCHKIRTATRGNYYSLMRV